jgi:hypothetical protein
VLEALALFLDREELKREYPELEDEDIRQALEYPAANLADACIPASALCSRRCARISLSFPPER